VNDGLLVGTAHRGRIGVNSNVAHVKVPSSYNRYSPNGSSRSQVTTIETEIDPSTVRFCRFVSHHGRQKLP
jgi:hypothetical protein